MKPTLFTIPMCIGYNIGLSIFILLSYFILYVVCMYDFINCIEVLVIM